MVWRSINASAGPIGQLGTFKVDTIQRVADYLAIDLPDAALSMIVSAAAFANVKQKAEQIVPDFEKAFIGGAKTFVNKGTNGRWRDVLTEEDLELYEAAIMVRVLIPDCAQWLRYGRLANA